MTIDRETTLKDLAMFQRRIASAGHWVGGDTTVAMNTLVTIAADMLVYAQARGAVRSFEDEIRAYRGGEGQ